MTQKGIIYTLLSAVAFGLTPLVCDTAYQEGLTTETVIWIRNISILPLLYLIMHKTNATKKVTRKQLFHLIWIGICGITLTALLLFYSYHYILLGSATTIHFMYPLLISLFGFICFQEKIGKAECIALGISSIGILFFFEKGGAMLGVILAFLSSITYAIYMLAIEKTGLKQLNAFTLTFYLAIVCAITIFIYGSINHTLQWSMSLKAFLCAVGVGLLSSFFAVYTLQKGIQYLGAAKASIYCMAEPMTSIIAEWLLLGVPMRMDRFIGCILILGAITFLVLHNMKKQEHDTIVKNTEDVL